MRAAAVTLLAVAAQSSLLAGAGAFGCAAWSGSAAWLGVGSAGGRLGGGAGPFACRVRAGGSAAWVATEASAASELGLELRKDFPLLAQRVNDKTLIYLDSAATSQKPVQVLDAMARYYRHSNANVHRGAHALSVQATDLYEGAREKAAKFVNADRREIVFTSGATAAINLVAHSWGLSNLKEGDEIILTEMEHHANIVPWQLVAARTGAVIKFVRLSDDMAFDLEHFQSLLSARTKLVSVAHVSNVLGCLNPVDKIIAEARKVGAKVLLDACQSVPHMPVDVRQLDCDWLAASGHKMCGPTGSGFLYGKLAVLEAMPPWVGGGEMIEEVFLDHSTFAPPPGRFEAGTPAIGECVGLGAACDYLADIGMDRVHAHETHLTHVLWETLGAIPQLQLYGPRPDSEAGRGRAALAAFNSRGVQASDLATFLDMEGVAIRSGHHCAQPLHRNLGISGSARASTYLYTTADEIAGFAEHLKSTIDMFANMGELESSFDLD